MMRNFTLGSVATLGCLLLSGCSDLILGRGLLPPEEQESAGAAGAAGATSEPDPQIPLSTACDFKSAMPRAESHGECDDDGWCWEDPIPNGAWTRVASLPFAQDLWLWSR